MPLPTEIDLYDWNDYSFYRALIGKPIPSPRVWDNAGRFGFKGGDYMKDIYFEEDLFEPTLYTKKDITNYINEKFGNGLRIKKGKGKLMKADKTNHKLVWTKENNHLYLNLEDFLNDVANFKLPDEFKIILLSSPISNLNDEPLTVKTP